MLLCGRGKSGANSTLACRKLVLVSHYIFACFMGYVLLEICGQAASGCEITAGVSMVDMKVFRIELVVVVSTS